jgi:hypothetical protein
VAAIRRNSPRASIVIAILTTTPCAAQGPPQQTIDIRNVDLHLSDAILFHARSLRGEMIRTSPSAPATLDDPRSYRIRVTSGTVAMTGDDLTAFLNGVVFAYPGSPLKNLRVEIDSGSLLQTGTLHKIVDINFRMRADVSVTPDGRIRVHPTKMTDQKLMHTLGLHMNDMIDVKHAKGVTIDQDDILIEATASLPPPAIDGRLVDIHIEGNQLVERFIGDSSTAADSTHPGSVHVRGGRLRFGRLTMDSADVLIVSANPHGAFDLSLPHYEEQLVAGYSQITPTMGLVAHLGRYVSSHATH